MPLKKKTPARKKPAPKNLREKINVLALIDALEQHVLGEKEMTATQVNAALALLKKTLPDMTEATRKLAQTVENDGGHEAALKDLE